MLGSRYNPLEVEKWVSQFWESNNVYQMVRRVVWDERRDAEIFAFLEGPPTANGLMHIGHARGRTFKDVKLRYARMKGYRVWDQAGWDTQGLPVELEVEKNLGFKTKRDIESYGVEKFIEESKKLVDHYIALWVKASKRLGLWLDYEHAYETRDPKYIESIWSFIKEVHRKGLLYEGLHVVPRCPRCGTALSSHEVAQGYEEVEDPSLYFKLPVLGREKTYLIAWTTTPWTIIANEAAVVHPDEIYVHIRVGEEVWIVAEKRLEEFSRETGVKEYTILGKSLGRELVGLKYLHPLIDEVPYHRDHKEPHHTVLAAEWVTMSEGTGIVHSAPAHGPEDFELAQKHGLIVFTPLQADGYFSTAAGIFSGLWFEEASRKVVEELKKKGLVVHIGTVRHEYPFCWRCGTRLFYYASRQWFIKVSSVRDRLIESTRSIRWAPAWAEKRMEDWVANARDWCISRERYWGTPLPVWRCSKCGYTLVIGSLEELRKYAVKPDAIPEDLHRPYVDRVVLRCPNCGGEMRREPFVIDVWMDSGVAHTASLKQYGWLSLWDKLYPYTWITEAADQTRGWFYTLLVTGVLWHDKTPFREVLLQGHVLDKEGKKMSKSKGNVIWALDWLERNGADPTRMFLLSRAPWDSINFDPDEVKRYEGYLNILWNTVKFADTYMELDKWRPHMLPVKQLEAEDRWILYELANTINTVSKAIENDEYHEAVRALVDLIVDKVSHVYIPLIRPRVWEEEMTESKNAAYATLFTTLKTTILLLAPFTPFLSEYLYHAFVKKYEEKAKYTVHIEEWPRIPEELLDKNTWYATSLLLNAAEKILALRTEKMIKRRWPLPRAAVLVTETASADLQPETLNNALSVLAKYANIKQVELVTKEPSWASEADIVDVGPLKVYVVMKLDKEALLEGLAREVIRRVQLLRKELNLPVEHVAARLVVYAEDLLLEAIEKHRDYIAREVRVREVISSREPPKSGRSWIVEDYKLVVLLEP